MHPNDQRLNAKSGCLSERIWLYESIVHPRVQRVIIDSGRVVGVWGPKLSKDR